MREKIGKLVVAGLFALGLILSPGADGYAQGNTKRNNNAWQQNQFWQQQRNQQQRQQFQQQQQRQLEQQRERERRAREAQAAQRQRQQAQLQRANDNPRPGTVGASPRPSGNVTYLKPTNSAKRATPPAAPSDASKLTSAQIKAGFKGKFANGKALVTVKGKTFAINPSGVIGKQKAALGSLKSNDNLNPNLTGRLTNIILFPSRQNGGKGPPGGGSVPPGGHTSKDRMPRIVGADGKAKIVKASDTAFVMQVREARARQIKMMEEDVGFNISPKSSDEHSTIGLEHTYITDKKAINDLIPKHEGKSSVTINQSQRKKIEEHLGLEYNSLKNGFKVRRISEINRLCLASPTGKTYTDKGSGNKYFLGLGLGLPGGHPEAVVAPIPTKDNDYVSTILTVEVDDE